MDMEDAGQTSGEECSMENGKQSDPTGLSMPPKLGEVLAAMHISLVLKMFTNAPTPLCQCSYGM